jgi:hypothetical protein
MYGVSCAPLLPVNLVSREERDAMINALFQNNLPNPKLDFILTKLLYIFL